MNSKPQSKQSVRQWERERLDHPLSYVHNLIVCGELSCCLHGQTWPCSTSTVNPAILAKTYRPQWPFSWNTNNPPPSFDRTLYRAPLLIVMFPYFLYHTYTCSCILDKQSYEMYRMRTAPPYSGSTFRIWIPASIQLTRLSMLRVSAVLLCKPWHRRLGTTPFSMQVKFKMSSVFVLLFLLLATCFGPSRPSPGRYLQKLKTAVRFYGIQFTFIISLYHYYRLSKFFVIISLTMDYSGRNQYPITEIVK
jgi:hypothetical protein